MRTEHFEPARVSTSQVRISAVLYACVAILAACQIPSESRVPTAPTKPVLPAAPAQATRYTIRSDLSDVRFLVYRAGPLAARGHNHVVQAKTITGEIALSP